MPTPPCILTIAGSDSGGGAGIQADLKTITVIGGFGMSVITALTAQNGVGVAGIHAPEPGFVGLQLKTVREGFPIAAAKTGMLFSAEIIEAVEAGLQGREFPLVVDPVCVSQSGQRLLREDAVNALRWHILPKADLLTPNRPEAELLADMKIDSEKDIDVAARKLLDMGPKAVLIKGGHFGSASDAEFTDWLALPDEPLIALKQPGVKTSNNHGTGCTLSAAIATYLGLGLGIRDAIVHAQKFLNHCLRHGYAPGLGAGPPNHASWIAKRANSFSGGKKRTSARRCARNAGSRFLFFPPCRLSRFLGRFGFRHTGVLSPVGTPPCLPCQYVLSFFIMMTSALYPRWLQCGLSSAERTWISLL